MRLNPLGADADTALEVPLRGADGQVRTYRINPPPAAVGVWVQKKMHLARKARVLDGAAAKRAAERIYEDMVPPGVDPDDDDASVDRVFLGDAYDRLVADGVSWAELKHLGLTVFCWIGLGDDEAAEYWNSWGKQDPPEPAAPNRAARRAKSAKRTGAASTTKPPASTSGTTSRPTSSRASKAASRPRGTTS